MYVRNGRQVVDVSSWFTCLWNNKKSFAHQTHLPKHLDREVTAFLVPHRHWVNGVKERCGVNVLVVAVSVLFKGGASHSNVEMDISTTIWSSRIGNSLEIHRICKVQIKRAFVLNESFAHSLPKLHIDTVGYSKSGLHVNQLHYLYIIVHSPLL